MSDWKEREEDLRSEYLQDAAIDASIEESLLNCKHEDWSITQEGLVDVESWKNGKKLDEPIAVIEIKCDYCDRESYGRIPYKYVISMLQTHLHNDPFRSSQMDSFLNIDEDGWGE